MATQLRVHAVWKSRSIKLGDSPPPPGHKKVPTRRCDACVTGIGEGFPAVPAFGGGFEHHPFRKLRQNYMQFLRVGDVKEEAQGILPTHSLGQAPCHQLRQDLCDVVSLVFWVGVVEQAV